MLSFFLDLSCIPLSLLVSRTWYTPKPFLCIDLGCEANDGARGATALMYIPSFLVSQWREPKPELSKVEEVKQQCQTDNTKTEFIGAVAVPWPDTSQS